MSFFFPSSLSSAVVSLETKNSINKNKNFSLTARLHKHPSVRKHRVLADREPRADACDASLAVGPASFFSFFGKVFSRLSFSSFFFERKEKKGGKRKRRRKTPLLTRAQTTSSRPRACPRRPSLHQCLGRRRAAWRRGRGSCFGGGVFGSS